MKKLLKLLICLMIAVLVLNRCGFSSESESSVPAVTEDPRPKNAYDLSKLKLNGTLWSYEDDTWTSEIGMDVSSHQGDIDWQKAAADGISFAMIRVGYRGYESGLLNLDDHFVQNIEDASAAGLQVGVYFFSQAMNAEEAEEEAAYVLQAIAPYTITCPVVYDMEYASDHDRILSMNATEKTETASAFCQKIKEAGYTPMIYGSESWMTSEINLSSLADYEFWVASYTSTMDYIYAYSMWQFTEKGTVDGISGNVDLNLWIRQK